MSKEAEVILNAFVDEGHNDIADFTNINPSSLEINEDAFYAALRELESMGCIKNILWSPNGDCLYDDIKIDVSNFKLHN